MAKRKLKWTEFLKWNVDENDNFIVCCHRQGDRTSNELDTIVEACKEKFSISSLSWSSTYAGDCFSLHWSERKAAYQVMGFLLSRGLGLLTQNRMPIYINNVDFRVRVLAPFTPEFMERQFIAQQKKNYQRDADLGYSGLAYLCDSYPYVMYHESSWLTEEGREFVQWVRSLKFVSLGEHDSSDEEIIDRDAPPIVVIADEPPEKTTSNKRPVEDDVVPEGPPSKKPRVEPNDSELCCICLVNVPSTLVLPCGHCVVCKLCSATLAERKVTTCVICRAEIDEILCDAQ